MGGYVGIPTSYTPVEYIESTGVQYIETGVHATKTLKTQMKILMTAVTGDVIFGFSTSSDTNDYRLFNYGNKWYFDIPPNNRNYGGTFSLNTAYNIEIGNNYIKNLDTGSNIISSTATTFNQTTETLKLFNSGYGSVYSKGRIYYLKIFDGDTLLRDFIPVSLPVFGGCLYEQVENKFYYNSGLNSFTAGPATGAPVSIEDKARNITRIYLGISGVARAVKKIYVGVNGVAKLCYGSMIPTYRTSITGDTTQAFYPLLTSTTNYILVAGGGQTGGSAPVKTVKAYNKDGTATSAPDLTTQSWYATGGNFNGYAICTSGKSASSGSSRTNQCLAYNNSLTKSTLSTSSDVFEASFACTDVHFMVGGGSNYSSNQSWICSYNDSFVKSTPTAMSGARRCNSMASVDKYVVCCGSNTSATASVDFYDNSNVKTTASSPYSNTIAFSLALETQSYAIFFGGDASNTPLNTIKAYDKNKVLTSLTLPSGVRYAQGFSTDDYACVLFGSNQYIYDDNLVLVSSSSTGSYGSGSGRLATKANGFAMEQQNGTTNLNIFDI